VVFGGIAGVDRVMGKQILKLLALWWVFWTVSGCTGATARAPTLEDGGTISVSQMCQ